MKKRGDPKVLPEGTIKTRSNGTQQIKKDGKWVHVKKPREEWNMPIAKPKKKVSYDYPPIKIPPNMKETSYTGYYITEEGDAYRRPGRLDRNGHYGEINQWGLIYLKPGKRGHKKYPEKQYDCINVSILDENGKMKQFPKSNHQLVAEAFVDNPHNYTEIMHMDENPRNNHYTNLKWGTHQENMEGVISPCTTPKPYKITDTRTGQIWEGINVASWVRENYDMIVPRMKSSNKKPADMGKHLANARAKGWKIWGFKVEHGV